jgi:hypothetical protein
MALSKIKSTSLETDATNLVLIKTQTVTSSVSSVEFVNGSGGVVFDSTYKIYQCFFNDAFLSTGSNKIRLRVSDDTGSTYKTSSYLGHVYRNYKSSSSSSSDLQTAATSINLNQVSLGTS